MGHCWAGSSVPYEPTRSVRLSSRSDAVQLTRHKVATISREQKKMHGQQAPLILADLGDLRT